MQYRLRDNINIVAEKFVLDYGFICYQIKSPRGMMFTMDGIDFETLFEAVEVKCE